MTKHLFRLLIVLPRLFGIYLRELVLGSLQIAWDAFTPEDKSRAGFVELDIEPLPDTALLAYCILIAMTPGSFPVDVSPDRRKLTVHAMYLDDPDVFRAELQRNFESSLRQLTS